MGRARKRPGVAAGLAVIYPGLGHVYLRAWAGALLWATMVALTAVVFVPEEIITEIRGVGDVVAAVSSLPPETYLVIAGVVVLNVLDAYRTAKQANAAVSGTRCPHCNRELDEELSFCHWCTAELRAENKPSQ